MIIHFYTNSTALCEHFNPCMLHLRRFYTKPWVCFNCIFSRCFWFESRLLASAVFQEYWQKKTKGTWQHFSLYTHHTYGIQSNEDRRSGSTKYCGWTKRWITNYIAWYSLVVTKFSKAFLHPNTTSNRLKVITELNFIAVYSHRRAH